MVLTVGSGGRSQRLSRTFTTAYVPKRGLTLVWSRAAADSVVLSAVTAVNPSGTMAFEVLYPGVSGGALAVEADSRRQRDQLVTFLRRLVKQEREHATASGCASVAPASLELGSRLAAAASMFQLES